MEAPGTITKEKLSKLTGIPVARLRQLASDGFFSKAIEGNYKLTEAIQGLFRYYKESSQELPVFDSIDACVGATGIPRHVIKGAKKLGCSAFHSNRVKLEPVPKATAFQRRLLGCRWESGTLAVDRRGLVFWRASEAKNHRRRRHFLRN